MRLDGHLGEVFVLGAVEVHVTLGHHRVEGGHEIDPHLGLVATLGAADAAEQAALHLLHADHHREVVDAAGDRVGGQHGGTGAAGAGQLHIRDGDTGQPHPYHYRRDCWRWCYQKAFRRALGCSG